MEDTNRKIYPKWSNQLLFINHTAGSKFVLFGSR